MANNTRALKLKANLEEYDWKLADIKRLVGFLEKLMNEIYKERQIGGVQTFEARLDDRLSIWAGPGFKVTPFKLQLLDGKTQIKRDSEMNLEIVRRVHDKLDVIIDYVYDVCRMLAASDEFWERMERFGVKRYEE